MHSWLSFGVFSGSPTAVPLSCAAQPRGHGMQFWAPICIFAGWSLLMMTHSLQTGESVCFQAASQWMNSSTPSNMFVALLCHRSHRATPRGTMICSREIRLPSSTQLLLDFFWKIFAETSRKKSRWTQVELFWQSKLCAPVKCWGALERVFEDDVKGVPE